MGDETTFPTTEELLDAARSGSSAAMDRLVKRYFRMVYAIAYARLENREAAEDLSQEVFLRVFLSLDTLKNPALFGPWASRIARNLAHDWRDKGWRASKLVAMVPLDGRVEQTVADERAKGGREEMESAERDEAVRRAIFHLPIDQRELVLMRYIEEMSAAEIAERLGVHITTVRRQLDKAIARLKESVEPILGSAAPGMRGREAAAARAVTIVAAVALLSATAKSSLAQAAGTVAGECLTSVSPAAGLLKTIPGVGSVLPDAAGGGISMVAAAKVAVVAVGIALAGAGMYQLHAQAAKPDASIVARKEPPKMRTQVKREGDKVWLEGVVGWGIAEKESSVVAAQAAIMQAVGENVSYEYLLGVSGHAFRMQVWKNPSFCGSSPHARCGFDCSTASLQALPWKAETFDKTTADGRKDVARKAIVASIDRGIPVQYGREEDGLIVGYQKGGAEWICVNPMRDWGQKTFIYNQDEWPWDIVVFSGPRAAAADRRKMIVESLRKAVKMANAPEDAVDNYYVGFQAWNHFIADVEALDKADDKTRGEAITGNSWIYECLASYRIAAAAYLREIAPEFDGKAAGHLKKAADLYEKMGRRVLQDKDHDVIRIAPIPWLMKPGETWTSEMRKDQVRRLKEAFPMEREAIGEIEKALGQV